MSRHSASCAVLPLYLDDKPTVTQLKVRLGNISNTYTEVQTPTESRLPCERLVEEGCLRQAVYLLAQQNAILQRRSEVVAPKRFLGHCL